MLQHMLMLPTSIKDEDIKEYVNPLLKANKAIYSLYKLEQTFSHSVLAALNESNVCLDCRWVTNQRQQHDNLLCKIQDQLPANRISSSISLEQRILQYMSTIGLYATKDMAQLDVLSTLHPVYSMMKELLKAQQFHKQWVVNLTPYYSKTNNRLELTGHWRSFTSYTGRITARQLSLTSIPNQMKGWIIPSESDSNLWSIDLSNAELRFLALYSGDEQLRVDLNNGIDVHQLIGTLFQQNLVYGNEVLDHRKAAKTFIFAMLYGAGNVRLLKGLEKNGYRVSLQSLDQIKGLIFNRYVSLEPYFETVEKRLTVDCFFGTLYPMIDMSKSQKRNFALQSSISTAIKFLALITVMNGLRIVSIIHDELVIEVPISHDLNWMTEISEHFSRLLNEFHPLLPKDGFIKIKNFGGNNNEKI